MHLDQAAMRNLAEEGNRLQLPEAFLDALPLPLAETVTFMLSRGCEWHLNNQQ